MFARVHTLETGPDEYERGYAMVRDVLLPWARESTGFRGLIGLVDAGHEESLVITLWADEESAERSASAGDRLSQLAATASGAHRASLREYAVTIFDVHDDAVDRGARETPDETAAPPLH